MIEDFTGMPSGAKPMKKHKRGRRGARKASDPKASLEAAHAALDRGDEAEAKRLALAAVHALHKRSHAAAVPKISDFYGMNPVTEKDLKSMVPMPAKQGSASRLVAALRHK